MYEHGDHVPEKKSAGTAAGVAVGGFLLAALAVILWFDMLEVETAIPKVVLGGIFILGAILAFVGVSLTVSALSYNSKVDLIVLNRGLKAEHSDHSDGPAVVVSKQK